MRAISRFSIGWAAGVLVILLLPCFAEAKESFGMVKKLVNLERRNPPQVLITGIRIHVVGKGTGGETQNLAEQVAIKLASELVQHDPRLDLDPQRPQTVVDVTVLGDEYETRWESRTVLRQEAAGKDRNGKTQYRQREVVLRFLIVDYRYSASYTLAERGKTLFADSLDVAFSEEFQDGEGAPTHADRQSSAVQHTVGEIVYALTPTIETIRVMVPKGSFESLINLAEAGLWSRYSEALESRPPLPTPRDESYRQYALGVAYEALGYGADDTDTTLRYLDLAAQHYNTALSLHPAEDFFTKPYEGSFINALGRASLGALSDMTGKRAGEMRRREAMAPLERVQTAMAKYQTLLGHDEVLAAAAAPATGAKALGESPVPSGMTNADLISMVQAGVSEDIVLTAIDGAESCAFDTTPNGLIALTKGKVGAAIIKRLQGQPCG